MEDTFKELIRLIALFIEFKNVGYVSVYLYAPSQILSFHLPFPGVYVVFKRNRSSSLVLLRSIPFSDTILNHPGSVGKTSPRSPHKVSFQKFYFIGLISDSCSVLCDRFFFLFALSRRYSL